MSLIGIWMLATFAMRAYLYGVELGEGGFSLYFSQHVAAAIHSLLPAVGFWLAFGRWL